MGHLLAWREGVSVDEVDGVVIVQSPTGRLTFRGAGEPVREALRKLHPPGADEEMLLETLESQGSGELPRWYYYLDRLTRRSLIGRSVCDQGRRLATLVAISEQFQACEELPRCDRRYVLSRFAYLRREGTEAVIESPLTHARVVLHDCRGAALIAALSAPLALYELATVTRLPEIVSADLLRLLISAGMVCEAGDNREENAEAKTWAFHDLLFHARSRKGRWDGLSGSTYRFVGELPPPPALKAIPEGLSFSLPKPDLDRLQRDDPPLAWVQEQRRSVREFDSTTPLNFAQLGEFLFRVNRVNGRHQAEVATQRGTIAMDFVSRPYPAGGALYELEFYLVVNSCDGLPPGLFYHDPVEHRLIRMHARTPAVAGLLRDAAESVGIAAGSLQVLIVLAARVPRVAWKYESIAYSLVLKHVGVVFQTMYLAATAMGLAACAVGGGDADLFARATALDYVAETSVGEFLLGTRLAKAP